MQPDVVPVAVVPLPYADGVAASEADARVARAIGVVGLVYGAVRLAMCGLFVLARWGNVSELYFQSWDAETFEGLVLASASAVVHAVLVAGSLMMLRQMPKGRRAMFLYAAGAALVWLGEMGVEAFYNYTGVYGDLSPVGAVLMTVQDVGLHSADVAFPALVVLLLARRSAPRHPVGRWS